MTVTVTVTVNVTVGGKFTSCRGALHMVDATVQVLRGKGWASVTRVS